MPTHLHAKILVCASAGVFFAAGAAAQTDTLRHIGPQEALTAYRYSDVVFNITEWGYVTGHNIYTDLEWAERYEVSDSAKVIGLIARHRGTSSSTSKTVTYHVYRPVGSQGKPLIELANQPVTHDRILQDGSPTYVEFSTPARVKGGFFVSFELPDYMHDPNVLGTDTLALLSSYDGSRDAADLPVYGRNMVRFHQLSEQPGWNDVYSEMEDQYAFHFAIFPVIEYINPGGMEEGHVTGGEVTLHRAGLHASAGVMYMDFSLAAAREVTVSLIDLSGRAILHRSMGHRPAGRQQLELGIPDLSGGGYIVLLQSPGGGAAQHIMNVR